MKTPYLLAALLAAGVVACGEKAPPPAPAPKVEAMKPAEAPKPPEAPSAAPASAAQDAKPAAASTGEPDKAAPKK